MRWTQADINYLKFLHGKDKYFFKEIAEIMGRDAVSVTCKARAMGLKRGPNVTATVGKWNIKHKHLREPVMKYFMTHTWDDTREHFQLTQKALKSLFTAAYRDPELNPLRKDLRRHDKWTKKELLFLVRHSGLMPRDWIAKQLKRGTMQSTKECLSRLNTGSKYLNGLSENLANLIVPTSGIKTQAGAPGPNGKCQIKIVPWIALEDALKSKKGPAHIRLAVRALARFQRWVHGAKTNKQLINKIKRIVRE